MNFIKRHNLPLTISRGFTLVQLLIVIALIAIITMMSIGSDQDNYREIYARKTAVEMQRYLEAGTEYYKRNARWPTSIETLIAQQLIPSMNTTDSGYRNPWDHPYHVYPTEGVRGSVFEVRTRIPNAAARAKVAQWLPGTHMQGEILHARISTEGKDNSIIFVGAERNLSSNQYNACPGEQTGCLSLTKQRYYENICVNQYGRKANFDVALQSFDAGKVPGWSLLFEIFGGNSRYDFYDIRIRTSNTHGRWGFTLNMPRQGETHALLKKSHIGQAVMFIYCSPIETARQSSVPGRGFHYTPPSDAPA